MSQKQKDQSKQDLLNNQALFNMLPVSSTLLLTPIAHILLPLKLPAEATISRSVSSMSLSSVTSSIGRQKLHGAKAFGKMRNLLEVHIVTCNGQPMKSNISHQSAYTHIYKRSLKLAQSDLHGIQMAWKGHPVVEIRLNAEVDIDTFLQTSPLKKWASNSTVRSVALGLVNQ